MTNEIKGMNFSEMLFNRDERLLDYITNLQEENERLKEINKEQANHLISKDNLSYEDYKSRNEKAIELVKDGIGNTENAIKFYKENQEDKDDFSSELHLLSVRAINLYDILNSLRGDE